MDFNKTSTKHNYDISWHFKWQIKNSHLTYSISAWERCPDDSWLLNGTESLLTIGRYVRGLECTRDLVSSTSPRTQWIISFLIFHTEKEESTSFFPISIPYDWNMHFPTRDPRPIPKPYQGEIQTRDSDPPTSHDTQRLKSCDTRIKEERRGDSFGNTGQSEKREIIIFNLLWVFN